MPVTFTTGLDYENMSERRKGFENFVMVNGAPQYGEEGNLRRNERNLMWNIDPYLQTQWQLTDKLSLDAGGALQLGVVRLQRLLHYARQRR
ncbi:Uncharacterised protein [Raoultella planticola]|uniref:Uncharacterized protein n=1 Tax=Raoultella planticola TaxID=575 RepID=A0A485AJ45_RAOPL|nr:Uncharacterised protein [Raoultella planticola]